MFTSKIEFCRRGEKATSGTGFYCDMTALWLKQDFPTFVCSVGLLSNGYLCSTDGSDLPIDICPDVYFRTCFKNRYGNMQGGGVGKGA